MADQNPEPGSGVPDDRVGGQSTAPPTQAEMGIGPGGSADDAPEGQAQPLEQVSPSVSPSDQAPPGQPGDEGAGQPEQPAAAQPASEPAPEPGPLEQTAAAEPTPAEGEETEPAPPNAAPHVAEDRKPTDEELGIDKAVKEKPARGSTAAEGLPDLTPSDEDKQRWAEQGFVGDPVGEPAPTPEAGTTHAQQTEAKP